MSFNANSNNVALPLINRSAPGNTFLTHHLVEQRFNENPAPLK